MVNGSSVYRAVPKTALTYILI